MEATKITEHVYKVLDRIANREEIVNWRDTGCTCHYFIRTGEVCEHIDYVEELVAEEQKKQARGDLSDEEIAEKTRAEVARDFD